MQLALSLGTTKHSLQVEGDPTVSELKEKFAAQCGMPADVQRWLIKGKIASDVQRLSDLRLADKAKIMVLRNSAAAAP
eukprot:CAMPEP_0183344772 /NCGR_PEP_ID=MMETSP0164_2-20130417/10369_1 /TAXON_ID=221442 /ORGANISM="Coccolithus pelagicus ssp braarudi, Strain PLY182g" /LENGTH=77 /DNA_ID=CAMNT_0025515827 /DNA_START=8 /DNA_END=237 /DNA_ORIENTATION=-